MVVQMKIQSLNDRGEEQQEEEEQEMQSEEITRSCSEILFTYSLANDGLTTWSDDDDEKQVQQDSLVTTYWLQQQVGKILGNVDRGELKDTTLLFRPEGILPKQWLVNKLPTRTLRVSLSPGIRRKRRSKGFRNPQHFSRLLPVLKKLTVTEKHKSESFDTMDKEEKQVCEMLSSVSLSHKGRKSLWTSRQAQTLGWVITVSFP